MSEHPGVAAACTLRKAVPGDVDAVTTIWHTGWRDGHIGHVPAELVPHRTEPQFRTRAQARLDSMWVAESDHGVVGFVTVKGDELEHLYVERSARGTGIAAMLIRKGEAEIASAGHARAWLAVVAGNQRARAFYARLGWRDAGPFTYMAETGAGAFPVPSHRYEIDLGSLGPDQDAAMEHNLPR
jgi:GNAT superfamily N-acetyltransferase